jgi:phage regulator Rha-like protein
LHFQSLPENQLFKKGGISMYELVELKENDVFTNSKIIAEGTGNQHHAVREIIKKYRSDVEEFGTLRILNEESSGGRPMEIFYLNEEQATFVITLLRNSKIVVKFKKELVRQFYAMRRFLLEKQSKQWQNTRLINKENRIKETDVIKMLVDYAKEQGSTHSDKLYVTYTKLAKSFIGKKRDEMSVTDLNNLTLIESIILQTIEIDMSMNMNYKDIYTDCKNRIEKFADIAYLTA